MAGNKQCKKCGEVRLVSEYSSCKTTKDRLDPRCKSCVAVIAREHYLKNKEAILARQSSQRENDPEYRRRASFWVKAWRERNPERAKEIIKKYQDANHEKINQRSRDWHAANREIALERARVRNVTHRDVISEAGKKRYKENREAHLARSAEWYRLNKDRVQKKHREWFLANPGWSREHTAKRKAAMLQAIPRWADAEQIDAVYKEAARISASTGIPHHVDHIVPLISKFVCGLHWKGNLRVLSATENLKKGNKLMGCVNG